MADGDGGLPPIELMMKHSLALFAQETLRGPAESCDKPFIVAPHHDAWDALITSHDRVCILAARDHGKSAFCTYAYTLWRAYFNPGKRLYIFSATQEQADRILSDIKDEIEDNPKLQHLLPDSKDRNRVWNVQSIKLSNGFRIYARGFGAKVRGAHPNYIVIDDGLNDEDGTSETIRKRHIEYFFSAITNMSVPGGQILVVGTPFAHQDLYGVLSKTPTYTFARFPAVNKKGIPLWPGRYDKKRLEDKLLEINSVRFAREFLLQPVDDNSSMFPDALFRGPGVEDFTITLAMPLAQYKRMGITNIYVGMDLAISASTGADYTVIWVVGLGPNGVRWIIDIERHRGLAYHLQLSLLHRVAKRYQAQLIFIEANLMQRVWGDELIRTSDLPIKKFITTGTGKQKKGIPSGDTMTQNKNSMVGGIPALRVMLENKKYRLPMGNARSRELIEQWIGELHSFVWQDGKLESVSDHDDVAMASWIGEHAVRAGGFTFSTGNEAEYQAQPGTPTLDQMVTTAAAALHDRLPPPPGKKGKKARAGGTKDALMDMPQGVELPDGMELAPRPANLMDLDPAEVGLVASNAPVAKVQNPVWSVGGTMTRRFG